MLTSSPRYPSLKMRDAPRPEGVRSPIIACASRSLSSSLFFRECPIRYLLSFAVEYARLRHGLDSAITSTWNIFGDLTVCSRDWILFPSLIICSPGHYPEPNIYGGKSSVVQHYCFKFGRIHGSAACEAVLSGNCR